jgi:large conductance mechanosensitive channel
VLNYGLFLQSVFDFLIIAFVIFLIVQQVNRWNKPAEAAPATPTVDQTLLTEIRDLLKAQPRKTAGA